MTELEPGYPVRNPKRQPRKTYFLGRDTGIISWSRQDAGRKVSLWIFSSGVEIEPCYRDRFGRGPTSSRLIRNTVLINDAWHVGLGIPDRRHRRTTAPSAD